LVAARVGTTNMQIKPIQGSRSGQSLVELAISLMIILMLLLGAVETSLALFQYVTIRDAAQEGAVYGSIEPQDEAGIKYRAVAAASDVLGGLQTSNVTVTINGKSVASVTGTKEACEGITGGVPNSIKVEITFAHPIAFPLVGPMLGSNTINLKAGVTNTILKSVGCN